MVESQIASRDVTNPRVLEAMGTVPRHLFVPEGSRSEAYNDYALRIGEGQTISQPYMVALMTELLDPNPSKRILEIGTGSGYQAAILSVLVEKVFTIEIKELLHKQSGRLLVRLGYQNVETRFADGYFGWEEFAPFDGIMITAAVDHIPRPLLEQLADGGRMVLPLGDPFSYFGQVLVMVTRKGEEYFVRNVLTGVAFVPMTGKALRQNP
jgi:protein-L-isoaspartate(D-aspartate) O-methyltransferase